jgi:hypothetical protein
MFSPKRFNLWISSIVSILFSCRTRSHSTSNAHVFGAVHFLTMTKPLGGVHLIVMEESLYWFTSCILCLQFCNAFATHFSPHQFEVTTKGSCETTIHNIKCTLDLHPDWGCFFAKHGKRFQFGVKSGHISKTSCNKWKHHTTHPLCLCILCIWVSSILHSKMMS